MTRLWYRRGYRPWSRLLHRFSLHHTRRHGPMEDGAYLNRCEWCGLRGKEWPSGLSIPGIRAEQDTKSAPTSDRDVESDDVGA